MKMTKKKVFVTALAICLIAVISVGTLAWFTAEDNVENKFEIMDSLTNFEIDVWEVVDPDGDGVGTTVGFEEEGNVYTLYEDVVPGGSYMKEVYVENNSNNELATQYVKVEVTFTNYAAIRAMTIDLSDPTQELYDCTNMLVDPNFSTDEQDSKAWWYDADATRIEDNKATYVFYLKTILADDDDAVCLFKGVEIPETMDINDAAYLYETNGFQINVVAYAIQSANIKDPSGSSDLDHARYAFGTPWSNSDSQPGTEYYPPVTTEAATEPEYQ